jgi:hypothetical protein
MLYSEIIAVCSQIHTKHINTLCGQNVEFLNVKPGGTKNDHCALKCYESIAIVLCTSYNSYDSVMGGWCNVMAPAGGWLYRKDQSPGRRS